MTSDDRDARLKLRSEEVAWRQVDDEIIVLNLRLGRYLSVNAVGATIWPFLVEGTSRAQLHAALVERFEVDEDAAGRDLEEFLATVEEQQLLE